MERADHARRAAGAAGHCGNFQREIVHPGHAVHATLGYSSTVGQWGDFMAMETPEVLIDDFYADEFGAIRDVSAVKLRAGIQVNESVCAYGRSSNQKDCSLEVANISVDCNGTPQRQVRMNGDTQIPADSGGPWFFGNTAYGYHRGGCGGSGNDHWSVADLVDDGLPGWYVPTV